jgi:hypothetical protein
VIGIVAGLTAMARDGTVLTERRAAVYGLAVFVIYLAVGVLGWRAGAFFADAQGRPVAADFVAFWAAGDVTAHGDAAGLYDAGLTHAVQAASLGHGFDVRFDWAYPPPLLLLVTPLSALSYHLAWLVWTVSTALLFALALRLILPLRPALVLPLAAPASLWCALVGQNGFLTAALMTGALALLAKRPWLAGLCVGLLTYKPQFGLMFPVFLIATGHFRAVIGAILTAVALIGFSAAAFGANMWVAFFRSLGDSGAFLVSGGSAWFKLQSLFAVLRQAGVDAGAALIGHAALVVFLLCGLVWLWTRPAPLAVKSAALVAGSFLATPYAYIYDAVMLTGGIALLAGDALARGFLPWEKASLLLALALPILFLAMGSLSAPLEASIVLAVAARRAVRPVGAAAAA